MISKAGRKNKNILINPEFQLSFLGYTLGMASVVIAVFYGANVYFFWKFLKKGKEIGLNPDHVFFKFLAEQRQVMDWIFVVTALLAFIFLLTYGFYLSHRVAGALRRFEMHLEEMGRTGEIKDLQFRKSDYFRELPEILNAFLKKITLNGRTPKN